MISAIPLHAIPASRTLVCSITVIDGDANTSETVRTLLRTSGWNLTVYRSGEAFLDSFSTPLSQPSCIICELTLPGMSGLCLQKRLRQRGIAIPIIFASASPSIAAVVHAMREGGFDFLEKPFHRQLLLERIQTALDVDAEAHWQRVKQATVTSKLDALSPRERDVLPYLLEGRSTKEIAATLEIGLKTVAKHRMRVLSKMEVETVVELLSLFPPASGSVPEKPANSRPIATLKQSRPR